MAKQALFLVSAALLAVTIPALSETSQLKPGLWEITRTTEARTGQAQLPSRRICLDEPQVAFNLAPEQACTQSAASRDASGRVVEIDCAPHTVAQMVIPIHLHQHLVPTAGGADLVDDQTISGGNPGDRLISHLHWLGAACGDVKPEAAPPGP